MVVATAFNISDRVVYSEEARAFSHVAVARAALLESRTHNIPRIA